MYDRFSVACLDVRNFRCHQSLRLTLSPAPVVLLGGNGAGKTSVLEALSLLAPGRGLRRARLGDLLHAPPPAEAGAAEAQAVRPTAWSIAVRLETPSGPLDLTTAFAPAAAGKREKRLVSIDGAAVRAQADLARAAHVLWLTPEMDRLFTEGPGARRRFLDRLVWALDPRHASRVASYERTLQHRSALLRDPRPDPSWLAVLEASLAETGVAIAVARAAAAAELSAIAGDARDAFADAAFPRAAVATRGVLETWLQQGPALAAEERMQAALRDARQGDAAAGGAAIGPHRSDVHVVHLERGRAAEDCSTGEQKMLVIALTLASARLQTRERRATPVMLLDDIAAHLDRPHREAVFAALGALGAQAWYAGTDAAAFAPLGSAAQVVVLDDRHPGIAPAARRGGPQEARA